MKAELEEKSPTFRFLNGLIGQRFGDIRNAMLTQEELDVAKLHAKEMMETKQKD
jgi:hypothetical protein